MQSHLHMPGKWKEKFELVTIRMPNTIICAWIISWECGVLLYGCADKRVYRRYRYIAISKRRDDIERDRALTEDQKRNEMKGGTLSLTATYWQIRKQSSTLMPYHLQTPFHSQENDFSLISRIGIFTIFSI